MGVIRRVGRVAIVDKSSRLYLRATIENKSRWYAVGESSCDPRSMEKAILLAKELDLDIDKTHSGLEFPHHKWKRERNTKRNKNASSYQEDKTIQAVDGSGIVGASELNTASELLHLLNSMKGSNQDNGKQIGCEEIINAIRVDWYASIPKEMAASTAVNFHYYCANIERMLNEVQSQCGNDVGLLMKAIRCWFECNVSPGLHRRYLPKVNKSLQKMGYLPIDMEAKSKKRKNGIEFFTPKERDVICSLTGVEYIKRSKSHAKYDESLYYATLACHFTRFCFYTGCRLGEAAGLEWSHINLTLGTITFQQHVAFDRRYILEPGLKTQDSRIFPINEQLATILLAIQEDTIIPSKKMVFPGWKGRLFPLRSFKDSWRKILTYCGIHYRKAYAMRHSFITYCLSKGIPVATIANWVGNSPSTIYKHYAAGTETEVPLF